MINATEFKTCGRDPACDLAFDDATLSRVHARLELAADGLVTVHDLDSSNGTFLNRNDRWVRVKKVTLCVGDRIRFGHLEVALEKLTAVFGKRANTRLEAQRFHVRKTMAVSSAGRAGHGPALAKPRRNPATGKIEEDRPVNHQP